MFISTLETIPGASFQILGVAQGLIVQYKSEVFDGKWINYSFGSEKAGFTDMMREAHQIAVQRMCDVAAQMGADAVIGVRCSSNGKIPEAVEVLAYGTAVKIVR